MLVPTGRRVPGIMAAFCAQLASLLAMTAPTVAAPGIVIALHGLTFIAWIYSANVLAAALAMLVIGQLSDRLGRRHLLVGCLVAFIVFSFATATAGNMALLILARAIGGIGSGGAFALSQALVGDIFPPRQRGRWLGAQVAFVGVGSALGPALGGLVMATYGWRTVFLIPIPLACFALALAIHSVPRLAEGRPARIDWPAIGLLTTLGVAALLALTPAALGKQASLFEMGLVGVIVSALTALVLHERRASHPLLLLQLAGGPAYRSTVGVHVITNVAFAGTLTLVPIALQLLRLADVVVTGLIVLPFMLVHAVGSLLAGQATARLRASWLAAAGSTVVAAFATVLAIGIAQFDRGALVAGLVGVGLGTGIVLPTTALLAQAHFPQQILGAANSTRLFAANITSFLSVPALTSLVLASVSGPPGAVTETLSTAAGRHNLSSGLAVALFVCAGCALLALPLSFKIPPTPLSDTFLSEQHGT